MRSVQLASASVLALTLAACERPTAAVRVNAAPPVESLDHVPFSEFRPTGRWHWDGPTECSPVDPREPFPNFKHDARTAHVVRLHAPSSQIPRSQLRLEYDVNRRLLTFVEQRDVMRPGREPFTGATVVSFMRQPWDDRVRGLASNLAPPRSGHRETRAYGNAREMWDHPLLGGSGKLVALALERCGLTEFATTFDEFLPKQ